MSDSLPSEQAFLTERSRARQDAMVVVSLLTAIPFDLAFIAMGVRSGLPQFAVLAYTFAAASLTVISTWFVSKMFGLQLLRRPSPVFISMFYFLCVLVLASYTRLSFEHAEILSGNLRYLPSSDIYDPAGQSLYDVLVSSTLFIVIMVICIFLSPLTVKGTVVNAAVYVLAGFYAYWDHSDWPAWFAFTVFGGVAAGWVSIQQTRKSILQFKLEYQNLKLMQSQTSLKYERELELAQEIQNSMAPPQSFQFTPSTWVGFWQLPHQKVGGDWAAFRQVEPGRLIVVVADATGKGIRAALIIHALQSLWAFSDNGEDFDAESWIKAANRTLFRLGQRETHSATLSIMDLRTDRVTYWSAGHCPLIFMNAVTIKAIQARGGMLGIDPAVSLAAKSVTFDPSDEVTLMLGTDGIFEPKLLNRRQYRPLCDDVMERGTVALEQLSSDDDKTLIVVRRKSG